MEPDDQGAITPVNFKGKIELKEVDCYYPTRPRQIILNNLSLKTDAGEAVALVGQSGFGKSTIIRLVERFYDPSKGSIEIDGMNIKLYNPRALRSHIAWKLKVIEAKTLANAHEFISSMQDGYETSCGERGVQFSGGQKQRIALARAILKNPTILLLDEATSALDTNSENLVQDALEKTMIARTCQIVAHRLQWLIMVGS
ncbi:hypothetical protein ACH5RR_025365 [Cinchona calisaya]|uniref:ABC transporter domain-containing protein n=1 Tax=Cinchona calisaya TaxID=153742 RepID=A0ABD2Z0J1_9GENT